MTKSKTISRQPLLDRVALTISPPLRPKINDVFKNDCHIFSSIMSPFILYPEFDKTGRLHYHGYMWKSETMVEDLEVLKKELGFIKTEIPYIDTIEHSVCDLKVIKKVNGWDVYCKKEWIITRNILKLKKPINNEYCKKYKELSKYKTDMSAWICKAPRSILDDYK